MFMDYAKVESNLYLLENFQLELFHPFERRNSQSSILQRDKSRDDLQQNLQISVNKIQILINMENSPVNELNGLLLGEGGLIQCINDIFLHGRKASRLRQNFAWDTVVHTK